jgi:hypothetical protein
VKIGEGKRDALHGGGATPVPTTLDHVSANAAGRLVVP